MQLHYKISSKSLDKPYAILIHGLFGDADNLAGIRRHLCAKFNVISVDLPNHGDSPHCEQFNLSLCVNSIIDLLNKEGIDSAFWIGHSLGGKVAMRAALDFPAYCKKLVVVDIAPVNYSDNHSHIFSALRKLDLNSLITRNDADKQLSETIPEVGIRAFLLKSLTRIDDKWQWKFNLSGLYEDYAQVRGWDSTSSKCSYNGSTLFIKGAQSDYIKSAYQTTIKALFPNAKAHVIDSAGHWPHAEKPSVFNRIVENFLCQ